MATTDYFENLLLGHALLQQSFSIEDWYVGLFTADPTSSGSLANEVSAADYERKLVSWDSTFANSTQINWAEATNPWGSITYIALLNSPLKGSGNMLLYEPTSQAFTVGIGRPLLIPASGLAVVAP